MRLHIRMQMHTWFLCPGGFRLHALLIVVLLIGQIAADQALAQAPRSAAMTGLQAPRRAVLVDIEEEVRQQNPNQDGNHFELTAEQLDYWVFNNTYEMAHEHHQALIKLEIAQLDAACGLSAEQRQMLRIAGAGELQRLADVRTVLQARYAGRIYDQNKIGEVFQELQPYQRQFQRRGLDPESLLLKLLPSLLEKSQTANFSAWQAERQRAEQHRQIEAAIADIEQQVPLTIAQRGQLTELFQTHTRPVSPAAAAQHISAGLGRLTQLNSVPAAEFEAFLAPPQWEALQAVFLPHRGYLRLLRDQNLLLDLPPAPTNPAAAVDDAAAVTRDQEAPQ